MNGPIGKFLSNAADALYSEVCAKLRQPRYASGNSDDHPRHFYFRTLSNILLRARERAHGGSFLVIGQVSALIEHLFDIDVTKFQR